MNKQDFLRKISIRKFWVALCAWITSILTAFNATESVIAQTGIIIAGIGSLVVYMLSEAYVDGKNVEFEIITETEIEEKQEESGD